MFSVNPFHYLKKGYEKITHPDGAPMPGGVGSAAANPANLVHDPATGLFFDPTTGTTYTDPTGQQPVKDPNVAQQVASNFQASRGFMGQLGQNRDMVNQAYQGESNLATSLNDTINNPHATSVAGSQLVSGLDQLGRGQLSSAAGVGGPNAAAARRQANINIGQQGTDLVQAKAGLRAQEVAAAQGRLGEVLGRQAGQGQDMYATNTGAASQFAGLAGQGAAGNQSAVLGQQNKTDEAWNGLINAGAGAAAKFI